MKKRIYLAAIVAMTFGSIGSTAYARGKQPVTKNLTCSSTNTIKCITRFDRDGDGSWDRWVYVMCNGDVVTYDSGDPDIGSGTPIGHIPFGSWDVGALVVGVNANDEWTFHLPIVSGSTELCSVDWNGTLADATSNCGGM